MEKEIVMREKIIYNCISFKEMIDEMDAFKKEHPNGNDFNVKADYFEEWGDTYSELQLVCDDIETDSEFKARCEIEEWNKQQALERKRAEFERLKKELGEE